MNEDYSNVRIALFVGCETGAGGEGARNLPQSIVDAGAEVAIGFTKIIGCGKANEFTTEFYKQMLCGKTVEQAAELACNVAEIVWENTDTNDTDITICGNRTLTLVK